MTTFLDFFADFGVSGTVAGVGLGSRPADWSAALGEQYYDASWAEGHLVRQFAVVDAHFHHRGPCDLIIVRLPQTPEMAEIVPAVITDRYGPVPDRVPFRGVAELIEARGVPVAHVKRTDDIAPERFWVRSARVMFHVVADPPPADQPQLRPGDLMSAGTDTDVDLKAERLEPYR